MPSLRLLCVPLFGRFCWGFFAVLLLVSFSDYFHPLYLLFFLLLLVFRLSGVCTTFLYIATSTSLTEKSHPRPFTSRCSPATFIGMAPPRPFRALVLTAKRLPPPPLSLHFRPLAHFSTQKRWCRSNYNYTLAAWLPSLCIHPIGLRVYIRDCRAPIGSAIEGDFSANR